MRETAHRYDIIFIDAFLEEAMPAHMNTRQFFVNLQQLLNNDGCLTTNCNLPTVTAYNRLQQVLSLTFETNILLAHTNVVENAQVIISGNHLSLASIGSPELAFRAAQRLEVEARLEFSLSGLISLAYRGVFNNTTTQPLQH